MMFKSHSHDGLEKQVLQEVNKIFAKVKRGKKTGKVKVKETQNMVIKKDYIHSLKVH